MPDFEPAVAHDDSPKTHEELADLDSTLLEMARRAHADGDDERAGVLAEARWRLAGLDKPPAAHSLRMDTVRAGFCIALIFVLGVVILTGLIKGQNGEQISQLAAPVSGLAGIGIGWLFSSASSGEKN